MLTKPSLTLKKRLKAQPAQVFSAWTDPEKIIHWFGPHETEAGSVHAKTDVRTGGSYRVSFKTEDGEYHEVGGTYREVVPDRRLVFTWAWHSTPERESLVTVQVKPDGAGTLLTFHHEQFFDETARDNHERGWTDLFVNLEKLLA